MVIRFFYVFSLGGLPERQEEEKGRLKALDHIVRTVLITMSRIRVKLKDIALRGMVYRRVILVSTAEKRC